MLFNLHDLAAAAVDLWESDPGLRRMVVKLNEGFSGEGNALLDLEPLTLAECGPRHRLERVQGALEKLPMPSGHWRELLGQQGALVEAWLEGGEACTSPACRG